MFSFVFLFTFLCTHVSICITVRVYGCVCVCWCLCEQSNNSKHQHLRNTTPLKDEHTAKRVAVAPTSSCHMPKTCTLVFGLQVLLFMALDAQPDPDPDPSLAGIWRPTGQPFSLSRAFAPALLQRVEFHLVRQLLIRNFHFNSCNSYAY